MCNHGGMSLGVYPLGCPWRCITGRGGGGGGRGVSPGMQVPDEP